MDDATDINRLHSTRTQRPRDGFTLFFAWGMERLTRSLRDGDEYGPEGFAQLEVMARRCQAFVNAFNDRRAIAETHKHTEKTK